MMGSAVQTGFALRGTGAWSGASTTCTLPVTANAGDLIVIFSNFSGGSFTGYTLATGTSICNIFYRVATGGETTATFSTTPLGLGNMALVFSATGGAATYTGSNNSGASITYTSLPSLVVGNCRGGGSGATTMPSPYAAAYDDGSAMVRYSLPISGSATGAMSLPYGSDTFCVFHLV